MGLRSACHPGILPMPVGEIPRAPTHPTHALPKDTLCLPKLRSSRPSASVHDPELHRSIVDLGMVKEVAQAAWKRAHHDRSHHARLPAEERDHQPGERGSRGPRGRSLAVQVDFTSMTPEELAALRQQLNGNPAATAGSQAAHGHAEGRTIPFADSSVPGYSRLRRARVAWVSRRYPPTSPSPWPLGGSRWPSSTPTWGFSIPRMLGIDQDPTVIDSMLVPPEAHGVRHLHGVLRQRGPSGDLAGTDVAQGARTVSHRRVLGRPRLPRDRSPPGTGDVSSTSSVPALPRCCGHHATAGGPTSVEAGGRHGSEGQPPGAWCHREHVLVRGRRRQALRVVRRRAVARKLADKPQRAALVRSRS